MKVNFQLTFTDLILLDVPAANLQGGGEAGAEAEQNV